MGLINSLVDGLLVDEVWQGRSVGTVRVHCQNYCQNSLSELLSEHCQTLPDSVLTVRVGISDALTVEPLTVA